MSQDSVYQQITDELEKCEKPSELYQCACVNYTGPRGPHKGEYSEYAAKLIILRYMNSLANIQPLHRSCYRVNREKHNTKGTNRREEHLAINLFLSGKDYDEIGTFIEYQVPLSNGQENVRVKAFDLLSYCGRDNKLILHELKYKTTPETLLRCILEAYTYKKLVNAEQLARDFGKTSARLEAAVLVFADSKPHHEYEKHKEREHSYVLQLMEKLEVSLYLLKPQYEVVLP